MEVKTSHVSQTIIEQHLQVSTNTIFAVEKLAIILYLQVLFDVQRGKIWNDNSHATAGCQSPSGLFEFRNLPHKNMSFVLVETYNLSLIDVILEIH